MDITGQYFCSFNIKGQPFNEVFKVVLEASVSLLDKNGILQKRHISKVPGRQLVIQNIMTEKLEKGIDLSDIAFDEQTDFEYNDATPDLNKSRYSDITPNTMSLRNGTENNFQEKAESKHSTNLQLKDIQIVQKLRQDCFWVHTPENLVRNSERSKPNALASVAQQKTNTHQISSKTTSSPRIKCTNIWVPPMSLETGKTSSMNKYQTVEAEDASHAESVLSQEIKKECVESDIELTNITSPNVEDTKHFPSDQCLPATDSVENNVPNEFGINHNKTSAADNSLTTLITRNSCSLTGTGDTNSDSYPKTAFGMDSKLSGNLQRIGQKSKDRYPECVRDVSTDVYLEKSNYFSNCDDVDVIDSLKTAFETNAHQTIFHSDNEMIDSLTVNDPNNIIKQNHCHKTETLTEENFNGTSQNDARKLSLLNGIADSDQHSDMVNDLNADEQDSDEKTFEIRPLYDKEQARHPIVDDMMPSQSTIEINTDNSDSIDLAEDTDSEDEEFFVFCDEPGDVHEIILGEVNNAGTQTHVGDIGDLEGENKQKRKKRKYQPQLRGTVDHAYSHKKKRKTKQKSRVKTVDHDHVISYTDNNVGKNSLLDCYVTVEQMPIEAEKCMSTTSKYKRRKVTGRKLSADVMDEKHKPELGKNSNVHSNLSDLKDNTTMGTTDLSQVNDDKNKLETDDDSRYGIRKKSTVHHDSHTDGETTNGSGRRNRRRRCNYNINYKQLDDLYESIGGEGDEVLTESQIKSESEHTEGQEKTENLESGCKTKVKTESDADYDPETFDSGTKATSKADSDYDPESFESGKKAKVTRKADPDYDPSDISDISDDEEDNHESPVSGIDSEVEGKIAERERKKRDRKPSIQQFRVDLTEHADKYEIVKFVSREQRNRGKPLEEISHDSFSCKVCQSYQTADENCMSIHIGQHIHGKLGCSLCGKEFSSLNNKAQHYKNEHPETVRTKNSATMCEMCGVSCSDSNVWRRHMYNTHKVPSFECRFCDPGSKVKYPTQKELEKHMKEEHADKLFSCSKCGKLFRVKALYKVHKASCKTEPGDVALNICHICNETFDTKSNLTKHMKRLHQKEKCFKCEFCSYATLFQKNMKRHKAIHLDLKKHQCSLCPYAAVERSQLQSHMKTHTGEKPFKCDKCAYAAAWNVQLKDHLKVHELETAVTCEKCGVVLKNNTTLKRHIKREHQ